VAGFFLVAFAIAWLGSFLVAGPKFFRGETIEPLDAGLMALPMLAAPILSGILMAFIVDGKQGFKDLFSSMRIWRVGKWYLTLLIFPFLILVVSLLLSATVSPEFTPIFLAEGILMGITAGFLEELVGWLVGLKFNPPHTIHIDALWITRLYFRVYNLADFSWII